MSRLPNLDPAKMSPEQKKVHDAVIAGPRGKIVNEADQEGVARRSRGWPSMRRRSVPIAATTPRLPPRLSELAICTTGAFWKANYEWFAHAPLAMKAGIERYLRFGSDPHRRKAEVRQERRATDLRFRVGAGDGIKRVSNATFERAKKEIGETGVIDLVGIVGYYSLVSVTLNTFELAVPDGEKVPFDIP